MAIPGTTFASEISTVDERQKGFLFAQDHSLGGSSRIKKAESKKLSIRILRGLREGNALGDGREVTLDWEVKAAEVWVTMEN